MMQSVPKELRIFPVRIENAILVQDLFISSRNASLRVS